MKHELFLTGTEQAIFVQLPASLREGWSVVSESVERTEDDPQRQYVRLSLLRLHDPMFQSLRSQALACKSSSEMLSVLSSVDFTRLPQDDLLELVFALGPAALSEILNQSLKKASSDEDLIGIAALSFLRHELSCTHAS